MIKLIATDVDGVLTNGKAYILNNTEVKTICYQDLDVIANMRKDDIILAVITGEKNGFTEFVKEKIKPDFFYDACKNKVEVIQGIVDKLRISPDEVCYLGDGKYDISVFDYVGVGVCPKDAIAEVQRRASYILTRCGGEGCLKETYDYIKDCINSEGSITKTEIETNILEHKRVLDLILQDNAIKEKIENCVAEIVKTFQHGGQLLLCGNGGSAADAQHLATELVSRFYRERNALNAEALTINTSTLTAIGNDYSFDRVFARQVEAKGKSGDVLIGISTSGESKNVIEAIKSAKQINMKTIAFTGDRNSTMRNMADISIAVPAEDTPRVQEMHILIGHIICELVEKEFVLCDQSGDI